MYADYEYYSSVYNGKLTEAEYTPCAERAGAYIDSKTDFLFEKNGLPSDGTSLDRRLKICACELAEEMHRTSTGADKIKTAEKVGNYSVTYASSSTKTADERLWDILQLYLSDTIKAVKWV